MNYLCNAQFFTDNYAAVSTAVLSNSGTTITNKPITSKFGGTDTTADYTWSPIWPVWSLKTDLSSKIGPCYVLTLDMGKAVRASSVLLEVEADSTSYPITDDFQMNVECNISSALSSNLTTQYTADDRFFGRRASRTHFYALMPRNISYRYYRIKLFKQNEANNSSTRPTLYDAVVKDLYVGGVVDLDRPPARGLSHQSIDLTQVFQAESGREYFLDKPIYQTISGIEFPLLQRYQVSALKIWSDQIGISHPFFAVLDPSGKWDGPAFGASFGFFRMTSLPLFTHQFTNYWSTTLNLKEVL